MFVKYIIANEYGEPNVNHFCLGSGSKPRGWQGISSGRKQALMVVSHFLKWVHTARVNERAAAASALARAYVSHDLPFEDRCAAEAALTLLLDDPSAKVRKALAETLALSRHAPLQIVSALASDQPEVASVVLARSPLLTDADLIERVASGGKATQMLIADRPAVSMELSAVIAEIGEAEACRTLVANEGADIATLSFRRMAERHGHVGPLREAMIADPRLPADCRHALLVKLGEALQHSSLVVALIGASRAERLLKDACMKASLTLIDGTRAEDYAALIGHLRVRGDLTASFIIRALKVWREVANGKRVAGAQEVSWLMLKEIGGEEAQGDLAALLKSIHLDALRENAREHALAIAAA